MVSSSHHLSCSEDITIPGGILVFYFTIASISCRYDISVERLFPCDCNRTLLGCTWIREKGVPIPVIALILKHLLPLLATLPSRNPDLGW